MIIISRFEVTYNRFLKNLFKILNPLKKTIIDTQCQVHKYINESSIELLSKYNYNDEYDFFYSYLSDMNQGTVWVDQDFNSSNHFYNPDKKRGLYGRKNALDLAVEYYENSLKLWSLGNKNKSLFYFSAGIHIIQDLTIPQHANIKLLDNHRQYENYIKRTYYNVENFKTEKRPYILESIKDYAIFNSKIAIKVYKNLKDIKNNKDRYYKIAKCTIPLAIRTSAGAMLMFYKQVN